MLTVEQFLKAGFKFVAGDKINYKNKIWTITTDGATYWNKYGVSAKGFYIEDLIWRKMPTDNNQPVPDVCWVQYEVNVDGYNILNTAKSQSVDWHQKLCKVLHWRPSIAYTINDINKEPEEDVKQDEPTITEDESNNFKSGDIVYHNNKRVLVIGRHPHHPVIVVEDYEHIYTVHHSEINK